RVHAVGRLHDVELAPLQQLFDDLLRDLLVQPGLAGRVLEERHPHLLDGRIDPARPAADQRVAAAEGEEHEGGERAAQGLHRTTTLTSRPGTTTSFTISLPAR